MVVSRRAGRRKRSSRAKTLISTRSTIFSPSMRRLFSITRIMQLLRYWCDCHRHLFFARLFLVCAPSLEGTLTLLGDEELGHMQKEKRARREARLSEFGFTNLSDAEKEREEIVSIGIFSYNRFDLLKRTCDSLALFLDKYRHEFRHEVLFFHDGPNEEIEG